MVHNSGGENKSGKKPRVLVVDDDSAMRRVMELILSAEFDVTPLESGNRAIEHIREDNDFDVVSLDLNMPGMSGIETLQAIKELSPTTEVLLVTAFQDLESANDRFLAAVRGTRRIAPLATMNPYAHNWRSVIRHLKEDFAGVILFPYLHNWRLDAPEHAAFFRVLAERGLSVWVNCALADDRTRHSGLACRPVAAEEVTAFCESAQGNDYVFQGLSGDAA